MIMFISNNEHDGSVSKPSCLFGGAEPLPISEAWGHIADESDASSNLEEGMEQTNLRKLPLCQVIVKNPLGQLWLVGKDVLQGPRNGR